MLKPLTAQELMHADLPEPGCIMTPWLPRQGLTMLFGSAGIGKTFLTLSVARAVASGQPLMGWEVTEPASVLYIDGEMAASQLVSRLRLLGGVDDTGERLRFLNASMPGGYVGDLSSTSAQSSLSSLVDDVDLVVVDNISCLGGGGDENTVEAWKPMQQWALELKARGKSVLFVHHAGKKGAQRGTSGREDAMDSIVRLGVPTKAPRNRGVAFRVEYHKARGFYGGPARPFECWLDRGDWRVYDLTADDW